MNNAQAERTIEIVKDYALDFNCSIEESMHDIRFEYDISSDDSDIIMLMVTKGKNLEEAKKIVYADVEGDRFGYSEY